MPDAYVSASSTSKYQNSCSALRLAQRPSDCYIGTLPQIHRHVDLTGYQLAQREIFLGVSQKPMSIFRLSSRPSILLDECLGQVLRGIPVSNSRRIRRLSSSARAYDEVLGGSDRKGKGKEKELGTEGSDVNRYKILFAGSDEFSCRIFEKLVKEGRDVIEDLVVITPRNVKGGRKLSKIIRLVSYVMIEAPLSMLAEKRLVKHITLPANGVKFWLPPQPFSPIPDRSPPASNILIAASFPYLIPNKFLNLFRPLNTVNVHPSILPRYRGPAPIQWSIINGDQMTGVSLQTLSRDKFDRGLILGQEEVPMPFDGKPTYEELMPYLADLGGDLLLRTLRNLPTAQADAREQDEGGVTWTSKINKDDVRIDWKDWDADRIVRMERAVGHKVERMPVWTTLAGRRVQLMRLSSSPPNELDLSSSSSDDETKDDPVGTARRHGRGREAVVSVKCVGEQRLWVDGLKTEGGKALSSGEWWNGHGRGESSVAFD